MRPVLDLLPELVQHAQFLVAHTVHRTENRNRAVAEIAVAQVACRRRLHVRQKLVAAVHVPLVPGRLPAVERPGIEGRETG
jgi:hypothetical protein